MIEDNDPAVSDDLIEDGSPPVQVELGVTPQDLLAKIRVVDAATGERIDKVLFADAEAGQLRRYAVEDGGLVLENDRYKIIEEDRAIRIEWMSARAKRNSF